MRTYKPSFRDRASGAMRETQKWYIDFKCHRQIRRRIPAERCRTEKQAEAFGRMVEALVTARQYNERPDKALSDWLHGLPKRTIKKLAEYDLISGEYVTASIPLSQHVADFEKWLTGTKARHGFSRSPMYVLNTMNQIRRIIDDCGFHFWTDITKGAVETCVGKLDVSSKTRIGYVAAIKLFGTWMIENNRAAISPVQSIKRVRWTKTETRRALTEDEVVALLRATAARPTDRGMTGVQRAVMYLCAAESGYRMNELRCLTVGDFDLDNAVINLSAEHTKNHVAAEQLIKRRRAEQYRAFFVGREASEPAFPMPSGDREVLAAFRRDLRAAGIKPTDERHVKIVFHSLRYCLASSLDRTGASLKERLTIMRHSDKSSLTLGTYTTLTAVNLRGAVEQLPEYPWPPAIAGAAEQQGQKREVA